MKRERFQTQARLLASTRMDGQRATAQDTNNSFEWVADHGWQQLVPVDSVEGQPVVAETAGGLLVYDTHNRLIPTAGSGGQLAHIDGDAETKLTSRDNVSSLLTLDFSDGSKHDFLNTTIPGGQIGPHGFFRITALAYVITNASRTVSIFLNGSGTAALTTGAMVSNANQCTLHIVVEGLASTLTGFGTMVRVTTARYTGTSTSPVINDDMSNFAYTVTGGTDNDWNLRAEIQASGAVVSQAIVPWLLLEYGYVS